MMHIYWHTVGDSDQNNNMSSNKSRYEPRREPLYEPRNAVQLSYPFSEIDHNKEAQAILKFKKYAEKRWPKLHKYFEFSIIGSKITIHCINSFTMTINSLYDSPKTAYWGMAQLDILERCLDRWYYKRTEITSTKYPQISSWLYFDRNIDSIATKSGMELCCSAFGAGILEKILSDYVSQRRSIAEAGLRQLPTPIKQEIIKFI